MASTNLSFFSFSLCFLLLCHGSLAQLHRSRARDQKACQIENLEALEPTSQVKSEGGVTEYWDSNHKQLRCAGVAVSRDTIEPRSLFLPSYSNDARLVYILQGRGITSSAIPGCPESFQSFQKSKQEEEGHRSQIHSDQHQRIHRFQEGDIIALPAGVAEWSYNDGEKPVISITVTDTSSHNTQFDQSQREFDLAGGRPGQSQRSTEGAAKHKEGSRNILSGFDAETLAVAFGISEQTVKKLQNHSRQRGNIVKVENGLHVVRPSTREEEEEVLTVNGVDAPLCNMRNRQNIDNPVHSDIFNTQCGRISNLNSQKLPILSLLQMSAERGVLNRNALHSPHWTMDAHSVVYITRGRGRVQIVGDRGRSVFKGELHQGQLVVVPQNFVVVKQAGNEGLEWVSFKTNDNAATSALAGKDSIFRGLPEEVLMNSYEISREEASSLKNNRAEEMAIFAPRSQGRAYA